MKKLLQLTKLNTEFLLIGFGMLVLVIHAFVDIPINTQMVILLSLVFLIGVPHGALDFLVDEQNEVVSKRNFSIKKFVSIYLTRLIAFSIFWVLPWLAFSLFMMFSIYHFGETDMSSIMKPNKRSTVLYAAYGTLVLAVLLLTHLSEIASSIPIMGQYFNGSSFYTFLETYRGFLIILFSIFFVATLWLLYRKGHIIDINFSKALQFLLLFCIIVKLPLLLAFTFYFALWHSILSVRNIFSYFKVFNNSQRFNVFCSKSILFSLLALGSIVGLYFLLQYFMPDTNLLFALLIVLSVLTLPHLTVMHNMYKNYSRN